MEPHHLSLLGVSLKLLAILFLVLLNGFFVAAEFAIVKVRATQIEPLVKRQRRAKVAGNVIRHLDAYLSATQLGITLASLGLGWLGEPFVADLLTPLFPKLGITSPTAIHSLSFAIGFSIITILHIVIGELAPKSLAIQRPKPTTLWVAMPLTVFYKIFYPAIWILNGIANFVLRSVGIEPVSEHELAHSEEELRLLLAKSSRGSAASALSRRILLSAFNLKNLQARNIMLPRNKIDALYLEQALEENLAIAQSSHHTRFPVCRESLDEVVGMVHIKDLLWQIQNRQSPVSIGSLRRDVLFFPEFATLETMLTTFLDKRCHMAIIVDEFGGTLGMVTLEDVLEELVGEIQDEFDQELPLINKISSTEYLVDGGTPLHDVEEALQVRFEDDHDATTLGGYVINRWRDIPPAGAQWSDGNLKFTVKRVEKLRVSQVLIRVNAAPQAKDEGVAEPSAAETEDRRDH